MDIPGCICWPNECQISFRDPANAMLARPFVMSILCICTLLRYRLWSPFMPRRKTQHGLETLALAAIFRQRHLINLDCVVRSIAPYYPFTSNAARIIIWIVGCEQLCVFLCHRSLHRHRRVPLPPRRILALGWPNRINCLWEFYASRDYFAS